MYTTGTQQTEEMPGDIIQTTIRPLITSFFNGMTAEQWGLLKSGDPDVATKVILADLLLNIITSVSKVLLGVLNKMDTSVSEENVQSSLSDSISQSFADVLDVPGQVSPKGSQRLTRLISKEVTEMVNSSLSSSSLHSTESVIYKRITPPGRLCNMINHACDMIKKFKIKKESPCPPRSRSQNGRDIELDDVEATDVDSGRSVRVSSVESFLRATTKAAADIISRNVNELIEPLLDDVPDSDFQQLQSETSREIEAVADRVAKIIVEENSKETDSPVPSPEPKEKSKKTVKVEEKIKAFFTKSFFKALIQRIVAQLKKKFHKDTKVRKNRSVQSLADSICTLLQGDEKQDGDDDSVVDSFKNIASGRVLVFTKELSDLLYNHITDEMMPKFTPQCEEAVSVRPSHANMYADIQKKAWIILVLMSWWVKDQVSSHSTKVTLALTDSGSNTPTQASTKSSQSLVTAVHTPLKCGEDVTALTKRNQVFVRILMQKLLTRICKKAKVNYTFEHQEEIIERLLKATLTELEDADITSKTFDNLDKAIFKDLCKKWGHADMMLLYITLKHPEMGKSVAATFKHHLTKKTRCGVCRFFLSIFKIV